MTTERARLDVDIVCVGFGPASAGFLQTLSAKLPADDFPQILCYERADDLGAGVSGVVTQGKYMKKAFTAEELKEIPSLSDVKKEKVVYLLDPIGASRRPWLVKAAELLIKPLSKKHAFTLPFIPGFLNKHHGLIFSMGQFQTWVSQKIMMSGKVQLWPGSPVQSPLFEGDQVVGVRLSDQGVDKKGLPQGAFMPGTDIYAPLTVVGDGPVGPVGQALDRKFGLPEGHRIADWAVGMKAVVTLPEDSPLEPGTVYHTIGYPEPEIFGFMYVYPNKTASLGVFVPSSYENPLKSSYRYLQHWMQHPYLWQYLKDATILSWGAKSLQEAGKLGEPFVVGDGFARIGEGSGTTNILTNSGVDEAFESGVMLADAVIALRGEGKPYTKENLEATYMKVRRASEIEKGSKVATHARDGFRKGFVSGMMGMVMTGMTGGLLNIKTKPESTHEEIDTIEHYYGGRISSARIAELRAEAKKSNQNLHDLVMNEVGWPKIEYDGKILISHQDALLLGGKVQAADGFADHVVFKDPSVCAKCDNRLCIAMCSGQAITEGEGSTPAFDREKCVHCGACYWNCTAVVSNIAFEAGSGGFHSVEN